MANVEKRPLGKSRIQVAPLAFGGNVFGWTADEATSFKLLDQFVDAGFNLIDTADVYSSWAPGNRGGESESIIGRWLKKTGKRDRVVIATKVGFEMGPGKKGLGRKRIFEAVEESLRRLQTDTIDLYQSHKDDLGTPVEETLEAFTQLIREGKVRAIGASQLEPARLRESLEASRAGGLASYTCLQPLYNLYDREPFESQLAPLCREYGLGVINFYSLAAGFLTGKYRVESDLSKSVRGLSRIKESYFNEKGHRIVRALDQVAASVNAPVASVAIAWVLANPLITAPIASATSSEQLSALIRATELKLDAASLKTLNDASGASHFDEAANQWDTPEKIEWMKTYARAIRERVPMDRPIRLIDFGCGTGLLSSQFFDVAEEILGIDTSQGMLDAFAAKAKGSPRVHLLKQDLETSELKTAAKYDLAVSSMAFHHLADPAAVLQKLKAAVAPGARIAVIDLDEENGSFHADPAKMGVRHFGFSEARAREWASRAGLKLLGRDIIYTIEKDSGRFPVFLAVFQS